MSKKHPDMALASNTFMAKHPMHSIELQGTKQHKEESILSSR